MAAVGAALRDPAPARGRGALVPAGRVTVPRLPLVHGGGQPRAERRAPARVPRRGRAAVHPRVPWPSPRSASFPGCSRCRSRSPGRSGGGRGRRRRRGSGCCSRSGRSASWASSPCRPSSCRTTACPRFPRWLCWSPSSGTTPSSGPRARRAPSACSSPRCSRWPRGGAATLAAWLGWLRLSPEAVAVADVSARNMAAQGQAATTDFLAQFRPLFGPIAGIFLLTTAALAIATWRRLPRPGAGRAAGRDDRLPAALRRGPHALRQEPLGAADDRRDPAPRRARGRARPRGRDREQRLRAAAPGSAGADRQRAAVQPRLRLDLPRGAADLLGHRRAGARLGGGPARLPALGRHAQPGAWCASCRPSAFISWSRGEAGGSIPIGRERGRVLSWLRRRGNGRRERAPSGAPDRRAHHRRPHHGPGDVRRDRQRVPR